MYRPSNISTEEVKWLPGEFRLLTQVRKFSTLTQPTIINNDQTAKTKMTCKKLSVSFWYVLMDEGIKHMLLAGGVYSNSTGSYG
jgi:hypothetical protein